MTGHHHDGAPAVEALAVPAGPASPRPAAPCWLRPWPATGRSCRTPPPDRSRRSPTTTRPRSPRRWRSSSAPPAPRAPPSERCSRHRPCEPAPAPPTPTLGGPGQWLLAIPAHHIAGLQVLVRSLDAGDAAPRDGPHRRLPAPGVRRSHRTVWPRAPAGTPVSCPPRWSACSTTPVAPTPCERSMPCSSVAPRCRPRLRARAERARVHLVATYGMSETAGGCVYDGRAPAPHRGRAGRGGSYPARRPDDRPTATSASPPSRERRSETDEDGIRWFRTDDVGHVDDDGTLHVDGRVDDLIITGGLKVAPRLVEEAILEHVPGIREVVVVGSPRPTSGGACVSALVVLSPGRPSTTSPPPTCEPTCAASCPTTPCHDGPLTSPAIPTRGPGKPDRRAVEAMFTVG
jgi:O-succinylbenzoic acid--CoA ligase